MISCWWETDITEDERRKRLVDAAKALYTANEWRRNEYYLHTRLYGIQGRASMIPSSTAADLDIQYGLSGITTTSNLTQPIIKEVVDAITAVVCASPIKSMFMTDGGDWSLRATAQKLNKFVSGVRQAQKAEQKTESAFKEMAVCGNTILKAVPSGTHIKLERVFPWEILVEDQDALYGTPSVWYQMRTISRHAAKEMFEGESESDTDWIDYLPNTTVYHEYISDQTYQTAGFVTIYEAWKLPECEDEEGMHVICLEGGPPIVEVWEDARPPFAVGHFETPFSGIWSAGVAKTLLPLQLEMTRLMRKNYDSMRKFGVPQVFLPNNSNIDPEEMSNTCGQIYKVTGDLPNVVVHPSLLREYVEARDMYRRHAFDFYGLNSQLATGTKPAGINSGAAYREYIDHNNTRLAGYSRQLEQFSIDVDRAIIDCARRMHQIGVDPIATSQDGKFVKTIRWSEISLDDSQYTITPWPVNALGSTPAARKESVMELIQAQMLPKEAALSLLDFPDLGAFTASTLAPYRYFEKMVDLALYDGTEPDPPDGYSMQYIQQYGKAIVLQAIKQGQVDGAPEDRLDLLRQWLDQVDTIEQMQAEAAAPAPTVPAAGVPGVPEAPMEQGLGDLGLGGQ